MNIGILNAAHENNDGERRFDVMGRQVEPQLLAAYLLSGEDFRAGGMKRMLQILSINALNA